MCDVCNQRNRRKSTQTPLSLKLGTTTVAHPISSNTPNNTIRRPKNPQSPANSSSSGTTTSMTQNSTVTPSSVTTPGPQNKIFKESLDEGVDPCKDFYQFTCGTYIKNHAAKQNYNPAKELQHQVVRQRQIKAIFDNTSTTSTAIKKMRTYRDLCMTEAAIEKLGTTQLRKDIMAIGNCPLFDPKWQANATKTIEFLTTLFLSMETIVSKFFLFDMSIRRYDDGKYMFFFSPEPLMIEKPEMYNKTNRAGDVSALETLLKEIFTIIAQDGGYTVKDLDAGVKDIIEYDKARAQVYAAYSFTANYRARTKTMDRVRFAEMKTLFEWIDWNRYITNNPLLSQQMKSDLLSSNSKVLIYKKLTNALRKSLRNTDFKIIANYYVARLVLSQISYLDKRFRAAVNKYKMSVDSSYQNQTREEECADAVVKIFPFVNDHLYLTQSFKTATETEIDKINIKNGVQMLINNSTWIDKKSKLLAVQKVKELRPYYGSLSEAKQISQLDAYYSKYAIDAKDSFQQVYVKLQRIMKQQILVTIAANGPMRELKSTSVDDIHYRYSENALYLPAALVEPPFFDQTLLKAYTNGALGTMIAREYMHGLDSRGILYNNLGIVKGWISFTAKSEFDKRKKHLVDQYSLLTEPQTKLRVNGQNTIDNNIVDNAAIKASYIAYKTGLGAKKETGHIAGYQQYDPDQVFFIAYGISMCAVVTQKSMKRLVEKGDTAPAQYRVNTVLSNFPQFGTAFKCPANAPMNPTSRLGVW